MEKPKGINALVFSSSFLHQERTPCGPDYTFIIIICSVHNIDSKIAAWHNSPPQWLPVTSPLLEIHLIPPGTPAV